jgi:hypothetical protein
VPKLQNLNNALVVLILNYKIKGITKYSLFLKNLNSALVVLILNYNILGITKYSLLLKKKKGRYERMDSG